MTEVKVLDSIMGSGKTSYIIQHMKENPDQKWIYIAPFLNEAKRVSDACKELDFREPDDENQNVTKKKDLFRLLEENQNIVSTHALFLSIDKRIIEILKERNYNLVLDESIVVVNSFVSPDEDKNKRRISKNHKMKLLMDDMETLTKFGVVSKGDDDKISWDENVRLSKYDKIANAAQRGLIYSVSDSGYENIIWTFPRDVFTGDMFSSITILTYLFKYQFMSKYMELFDIKYSEYYVKKDNNGRYFIVYSDKDKIHDIEIRKKLKEKIHILYDSKLNEIGNIGQRKNEHPFSVGWWNRNTDDKIKIVSSNTETFFRYKCGKTVLSSEQGWTVFLKQKDKIAKNSKYISSSAWLAFNKRASNEYGHKQHLAYLVNRFARMPEARFFQKKGVEINHEEFATSEMLQLIFRFAIRNGEDIYLYIPSFRMRTLLKMYLDGVEPSEYSRYYFSEKNRIEEEKNKSYSYWS